MLRGATSDAIARIPGYRLLELLAGGGMGRVYRGEHARTGLAVAVKVIDAETARIGSGGARLFNEARLLARINHPNVVTVYDCGRLEDGSFYQVMELVSGQELTALLRRRATFSAVELLPFVRQVALALHAAHGAGVVHRDLKPQNIVVTSEQPLSIKVLDFGIAFDLEEGSSELVDPQQVLGTPLFISPEQLRAPEKIGPATDIYSLGVLLYWMLAGRPPFAGDTLMQLLAAHLMQQPPPLLDVAPAVSPAIAHLVHRCLEKAPEARPAGALALAREFADAVLDGARSATAAHVLNQAPGWAAYAQLAKTELAEDFDEEPTVASDPPIWRQSFDDDWLLSAEFSAPTIVQPGAPNEGYADAGYADEPTVVDRTEAEIWGTGLSAPTSIDLELHMANTLILRRSRSRTRRWLRRLIPWHAAA